jgi:hypothetical protein
MKIKIPPRAINGKYKSPDCDFGPTRQELRKILKSYNLSTDGWKKDYHARLLDSDRVRCPYQQLLIFKKLEDVKYGKVFSFALNLLC